MRPFLLVSLVMVSTSAKALTCYEAIDHTAGLNYEVGRRTEELRSLEASGAEKSAYGNTKEYVQGKISTLSSAVEEAKLSAWRICSTPEK